MFSTKLSIDQRSGSSAGQDQVRQEDDENNKHLEHADPLIGGLAELVTDPDIFPYEDIPGFPRSTVEGSCKAFIQLFQIQF